MTTGMGGWGIPGVGSDRLVTESEIYWGADQARNAALWLGETISSTTLDAGNSPTHVLRPGLLLGKLTADGKLTEWDADATDGSQDLYGILDTEMRIQDFDGTVQDRLFRVLVGRAPIKPRKLLIQGSAFVTHADEYLARRHLARAGFVMDDDPFNYLSGLNQRIKRVTGAADTLTAAENGCVIFYSNAASTTVTLPTLQAGIEFDLIREGDEEFVIASAAGDDIIAGNDLSADSLTFTTATEHIGVRVKVRGIYMGTTLKWLIELPNTPFGTAIGNAQTMSIAT